jgi:hypothetical protein
MAVESHHAEDDDRDLAARHGLSSLRHTTTATGAAGLAREQLRHFSIDEHSDAIRADCGAEARRDAACLMSPADFSGIKGQ